MKIAVDAMGGDLAPGAVVQGAVQAARRLGVAIALVGPTSVVEAELARHATAGLPISVMEAPDVIQMDESPLAALRRKPRASVRVAADMVARGDAQALFSAGHTGAALIAAHAAFGNIPGIDRPAIAFDDLPPGPLELCASSSAAGYSGARASARVELDFRDDAAARVAVKGEEVRQRVRRGTADLERRLNSVRVVGGRVAHRVAAEGHAQRERLRRRGAG
jgi:hypothetical protein